MISDAVSGSILPRSRFTIAEASFKTPKAWMSGAGMVSAAMAKWCSDRAVWAPQ